MIDLAALGLNADAPLVVGVSGGADSLALLHLLRETNLPLWVCHFNHRLRPQADAEAAHVAAIAARLGLPFLTNSAEVAAYAAQHSLSIEEAARKLRYTFLFRAARAQGAQAVAVAHTADDQVETVLMHFLRGAGLSGLKGMTPRTILPEFDAEIPLVRPILHLWRHETEAICHAAGLDFVTDPSNADTTYFRNRLRHELLPLLAAYNPQIKSALWRTSQALQGDFDALTRFVDALWGAAVREHGPGYVAFDLPVLRNAPDGMRRNLLRRAAFLLRPTLRDVDFDALSRAARLHSGDFTGGLYTLAEDETFYLAAYEADLPRAHFPQVEGERPLTEGENALSSGWVLTCERTPVPQPPISGDPFTAYLAADLAEAGLRVRPFRPGDRFEPLGMPGQTVKLSDLFVNLKIPKRARARWPLVCVGESIAWVAGLRLAHPWRITETTRQAWKLYLRKV
ncbi:MAG: tRNA lysidine(34) synthetase TilS [Anaerolineales bacterium]